MNVAGSQTRGICTLTPHRFLKLLRCFPSTQEELLKNRCLFIKVEWRPEVWKEPGVREERELARMWCLSFSEKFQSALD